MRESVASVLARFSTGDWVPCRITQASPLLVSINGTTSVPAERVTGLTYNVSATDNNAYAVIKPGKPVIIPIG
jgi:hypothetical protein